MNRLGKHLKKNYGIEVECVGRKAVILPEGRALSVPQLMNIRNSMLGATRLATELEVLAYDGADVPGDQHPQLMLRLM